MKEWYFDLAEFKPEVGFEFNFEGKKDDKRYLHLCKVTEVISNRKLSYTWRYEGYAGNSLVSFELLPEGDNTRLKLTHENVETFPQDNPDLGKDSFAEGWNYIIKKSLKEFVETGVINKSIDIHLPVQRVWHLLVDVAFTNQWAQAFSAGTYIETNWDEGSHIIWRDSEGDIGAKGVVKVKKAPTDLIVQYYDDVDSEAGDPLGEYIESYQLREEGSTTRLTVSAGPLSLKYTAVHEPLWAAALKNIKELAERHFSE